MSLQIEIFVGGNAIRSVEEAIEVWESVIEAIVELSFFSVELGLVLGLGC